MSIISKMRRQNAIYWPPAVPDDFGRPAPGAPVELTLTDKNYRVRWEDRIEQYIDKDGVTQTSRAVVYVPQLKNGVEVVVGGYLWLGNRINLASDTDPRLNVGAFEIKRVDHLPNLKNTETLRTCYL